MTDVVAPSSSYFDFQIPSTFLWRYGRVRSGPVRVPELKPEEASRLRRHREEGREPGGDAAPVAQTSADSEAKERDELRIELVDLTSQISALRLERDGLLAAVVSLNAEASDLQSKQRELTSLRSEIQALRTRKSSLERSITSPRRTPERMRWGRTEFHDS